MTTSASAFLQSKPSRQEYRRHIRTACQEKRAELREIVIQRQTTKGRSKQQAERDADEFFSVIETQMLDLQPITAR
jgi:hypothetical protein